MEDRKILLIEDNQVNLKLINDILTSQGYVVISASNGKSGLEELKKDYGSISLILLDLKLPDIDGIEVIKKIKSDKKNEKIPIIVISAHAMEGDIKASMEAGCYDYITKPINIKDFLARIGKII